MMGEEWISMNELSPDKTVLWKFWMKGDLSMFH